MALTNIPALESLKGRENLQSWRFAARAYLECENLWDVVEGTETLDDEKLRVRDRKANAKIILLVEPSVYPHIEAATTAKEAWDALQKAFEDSGVTRKVGLLRQLINTRLENCKSIEEYVSSIVSTSQRLSEINFEVGEDWLGALLLAGLPDSYKPMIMGLENSGIPITGDLVKLLQDVRTKTEARQTEESAFDLFFFT